MNDTNGIPLEKRLRSQQMRLIWQESCSSGNAAGDEQFAELLAQQARISVVAAREAMAKFVDLGSSNDPKRAATAKVLLGSFLGGQVDIVGVNDCGDLIWTATPSALEED